jgi:hypothetical protein
MPNIVGALTIVKPDTVIRWHRAGFRLYWRWKSRRWRGRPAVPLEIRRLIHELSITNPLWERRESMESFSSSASTIGQTSVTNYMARKSGPPSQGWRTFLPNHADGIVAMDLFVATNSFRLLYGLLIVGHGRRQILWLGVTAHPTAEWIANQLTEACGREQVPRYVIRDRDPAYGEIFVCRVSVDRHSRPPDVFLLTLAKWLRRTVDRLDPEGMHRSCRSLWRTPSAPRSLSYKHYYNATRTHLSLNKDAPVPRGVEWARNCVGMS